MTPPDRTTPVSPPGGVPRQPGPRAPAPRKRSTVQRRVVSAATERLPLKGAALFFAVVLWLVVNTEEPTEEMVAVDLRLTSTDTSVVIRRPLPQVRALVVGRGRELLKLLASPPVVRRVIMADSPEALSLRLTTEMVSMPDGIDARVRDVQPRAITVQLDIAESRLVPVRSALTVSADSGVRVTGPPVFAPDSVRVSGSRAAVRTITGVPTARVTVQVRDTTSLVVALDTAGLRVRVSPGQVRVRIPIVVDSVPAVAPAVARDGPAARP